jgi:hypothetical protein
MDRTEHALIRSMIRVESSTRGKDWRREARVALFLAVRLEFGRSAQNALRKHEDHHGFRRSRRSTTRQNRGKIAS